MSLNKLDTRKKLFSAEREKKLIMIAGPCSAETENQVLNTAIAIKETGKIDIFRAGVWKPRTNPGGFEGVGKKALAWMRKVKDETGLLTAIEVATPEHVEAVLKCESCVDIIWIGARTTVNPFSVQALADSLVGVDIPVMIKNPLNPDVKLWAGAIERIKKAGIDDIAAIHRGFYPFEKSYLRNIPKWELAIELKSIYPEIPIINDPSHIAGRRDLIQEISQKALNLNLDGLMIETHISPDNAWSDAKQQVTPSTLNKILSDLSYPKSFSENKEFTNLIEDFRQEIDEIDFNMLDLLAQRMDIVKKIGEYKSKNHVTIFQLRRWLNIIQTRQEFGDKIGLNNDFVKKILQLVHKESIKEQSNLLE